VTHETDRQKSVYGRNYEKLVKFSGICFSRIMVEATGNLHNEEERNRHQKFHETSILTLEIALVKKKLLLKRKCVMCLDRSMPQCAEFL